MNEERSRRFDELFMRTEHGDVWVEFLDSVTPELGIQFAYARKKHGPGNTAQNPEMELLRKLAILMEEVGEVATALQGDPNKNLATELLQVAAVALMWYDSVR